MRPDLVISVSLTTRHPRPGEVDGCDYYFTTPEHFRKLIHEEAFLEWAKVHGEYYGTLKETTLEQLERGGMFSWRSMSRERSRSAGRFPTP